MDKGTCRGRGLKKGIVVFHEKGTGRGVWIDLKGKRAGSDGLCWEGGNEEDVRRIQMEGSRRSLQGKVNRRVKAERGREEEEVQEGRREGGRAGSEEEEWKVYVRSSQPFLTPHGALLAALHSLPRFYLCFHNCTATYSKKRMYQYIYMWYIMHGNNKRMNKRTQDDRFSCLSLKPNTMGTILPR